MQKISYVIPCYRSRHTVGGVVAEIAATMQTAAADAVSPIIGQTPI